MQLPFRRNHPEQEPSWRRLSRVAGEINPFLLIIAAGLLILYLTCLVGLAVKLPVTHVDNSTSDLPSSGCMNGNNSSAPLGH